MRPQCRFLLGGQLKHEVDRESCKASLDLFVESFGRHAIKGRQIAIEKNILMSEDQNEFGNRIYAQRRTCIDPQCHHEAYESNPLHCQTAMMGNQSRNTAWVPRYGRIVSKGDMEGRNPRQFSCQSVLMSQGGGEFAIRARLSEQSIGLGLEALHGIGAGSEAGWRLFEPGEMNECVGELGRV
jgi:hypothetical protein